LLPSADRTAEEVDTVRDGVTHEEVGDGGDGEVGKDLDQGVHLVLLADRAEFEESEAGVHRENHDPAEQDEQRVRAGLVCVHGAAALTDEVHQRCKKRATAVRLHCDETSVNQDRCAVRREGASMLRFGACVLHA
jgi:hypothetical protein